MEYRPLPEDRREEFQEYVEYAFSPEDGPGSDDEQDFDEQPGDERGLFEDDELLATCCHYWFRTRLRGRWTEMPGLAAVASPPEHRRKGNVTRLLAESLAEYRDRGDFLTALWAFEHSFYERQGWGLATKYARYECAPEDLAFARERVPSFGRPSSGQESGAFRRLDADDYHRLDPVLAAANEGYELAVDRTERWWRKRVFENRGTDPYVYGWEDDAGELRGYVVYRVVDGDEGKRLAVDEFVAADHEARLHCLRFLANHDSQVDAVRLYGKPDASLLDVAADPADVECEIRPGPMARLVDVARAIEAFEYPGVADAEFTLSVSDPLADWNDGTFRVALADGRATCDPATGRATCDPVAGRATCESADEDDTNANESANADATTSVNTLSQVYVGYHSVADAEVLGDLELRDSTARDALTAMFPERDAFLGESF